MNVLIVGSQDSITRKLATGLVYFEPDITIATADTIKTDTLKNEQLLKGIIYRNSSQERITKDLRWLEEHSFARPIVVFGNDRPKYLNFLMARQKISYFISDQDIKNRNQSCFDRILNLFRNGDKAVVSSIEEEYRRIDSGSFSNVGAVMVADTMGEVTYANSAFIKLTGYQDEEQLLGKSIIEELGSLGDASLLLGELKKGGGWHGELLLTKKDGGQVYTNLFASLAYDEAGHANRVVYSFRDITAQKSAESKLRRINNALKVIRKTTGVINSSSSEKELVERVCKVIIENTSYPLAWISYLLEGEEGDLIPVACAVNDDVRFPEDYSCNDAVGCFNCKTNACINSKDLMIISDPAACGWKQEPISCFSKSGIESILCFPLKNKGKAFGILGIGACNQFSREDEEVISLSEMADDIAFAVSAIRAEVRHENLRISLLEQKGVTSKRMAEIRELNKVLEAYDYSVSNALKVPLRYIEGYTQFLEEQYGDQLAEAGKEYLAVINRSVKDARKITDNLSMLSKAAHQDIELEEVDLSIIANSVAANLQQVEPGRKVKFRIEEGVKCYASMHLATVLIEILFENAWKGTECSLDGIIEFGKFTQDEKEIIFLQDNGCGFDSQRARSIFTPFHSYHTDSTFEGVGLGLATAERIINRHGGKIWAEGELGVGATFYFFFPARDEN